MLVRFSGSGDLVNALAAGAGVRSSGVELDKSDDVFRIEYSGEQEFRLDDPHIEQETRLLGGTQSSRLQRLAYRCRGGDRNSARRK